MVSENNRRIAKNTLMLYIRMLLVMVVTLYTSRVVLNVLGVEDFGIYNVVGGIVVMLSFLNSSMSIAVQRFFSFELGRKDKNGLKKIFNISLITHIAIALIVLLLAETVGLWFVKEQLNIPSDRLYATIWVYQYSILSCVCTIIQVPYNADIISNEKMAIYAYISIIEVVMRLLIVYALLIKQNWDNLIIYGFLTFITSAIITLIYIIYCLKKFPESHFCFIWDKALFRTILSFASWSMLGELAWICTLQGVNVVLNLFFGPVVNAARGISYQVNSAISRFSSSFQIAVNPQIIKSYASNDISNMMHLTFRSTCFSYYLLYFLSLPLLLETEAVLKLWLNVVPEYTVFFCRLVIIASLIDALSNLLATLARATGKIRYYQSIVSIILMLNLPISYLTLKLGGNPESTFYIYGGISTILLFVRLYLLKRMVNLSVRLYIKEVLTAIFIVSLSALIIPLLYHLSQPPTLWRFISTLFLSFLFTILSVYLLGIKSNERLLVNTHIKKILKTNNIWKI